MFTSFDSAHRARGFEQRDVVRASWISFPGLFAQVPEGLDQRLAPLAGRATAQGCTARLTARVPGGRLSFDQVMNITRTLTAAGLAAASALLAAAPAHAGVIDGSLNNLQAAAQANVLGSLVNSKLSGNDNNNANSRYTGAPNGVLGIL
jgi:hypothetical protein